MTYDTMHIPEWWAETTLGEFIDVKHWYAFSWEFITDIENSNVLLTPWNFLVWWGWKDWKKFYSWNDIPSQYILKSWDIVLTMTDLSKDWDTLWYPAVIPKTTNLNFLHNQRVGLIQFTWKEINKDYLYWKLRTKDYQKTIINSATGSTVRHTSPWRIKEYKFFLPPLPEQQSISDMLSSLDAKIELLREQNEILEKTAQMIFHEWFGRYSVESPEELPEGWRVGKLGEFSNITSGKRPWEISEIQNENFNIPLIWASKIMWYVKDFLFEWSTLVIWRVWTHGEVQKFYEKIYPSDNTLVIQSENFAFVYFILKSIDYEKMNRWAVQPLITQTDLKNYPIVFSDFDTLNTFKESTKSFFEKMQTNNLQIQCLSKTRDTLLPKLMSGEVRI